MKSNTTICINVEVLAGAKARGINISQTTENILKEILKIPEEKNNNNLNIEIAALKARLATKENELEKEKKKQKKKEEKELVIYG